MHFNFSKLRDQLHLSQLVSLFFQAIAMTFVNLWSLLPVLW